MLNRAQLSQDSSRDYEVRACCMKESCERSAFHKAAFRWDEPCRVCLTTLADCLEDSECQVRHAKGLAEHAALGLDIVLTKELSLAGAAGDLGTAKAFSLEDQSSEADGTSPGESSYTDAEDVLVEELSNPELVPEEVQPTKEVETAGHAFEGLGALSPAIPRLRPDGIAVLTELLPHLRLEEALESLVAVQTCLSSQRNWVAAYTLHIAVLKEIAEMLPPQVFVKSTVLEVRACLRLATTQD